MHHKEINIFGACARVHLKFEKNIRELASGLSYGLAVPEFEFKSDSLNDNSALVGTTAGMGFELQLSQKEVIDGYPFCLEAETELVEEERSVGRMYDLSPWLARTIAELCLIDSLCIVDGNRILFGNGGALVANDKQPSA